MIKSSPLLRIRLFPCFLCICGFDSSSATASESGPFRTTFLANEGQWPGHILYKGRSATANVAFLSDGLSFSQVEPEDEEEEAHGGSHKDHHAEPEFIVWNMRFENMDTAATLLAVQGRPSVLNYIMGGVRSRSVVHPTECERLVYQGLYPGIDAEFRMNGLDLEYDYRVHAGADPARIRNSYAGIERLSINAAGDLVVRTSKGEQVQRAPVSWQVINGAKRMVDVDFVLHNDSTFGFTARKGYDPAYELIIDPLFNLVWSSYTRALGASDNINYSFANAMDAQGNVYLTGFVDGSFPTTPGAYSGPGNVYPDVFVAKFSSDGTTLVYSTYLPGNSGEVGTSIAVDALGRAYVTGVVALNFTGITDFPSTPNAYQPVHDTGSDVFLTVLDPTGSSLVYSTFFGGIGSETGYALALGTTGIAYVTGTTTYLGFPVVNAAAYPNGQTDVFVAKFDIDQSGAGSLIYSVRIGDGDFAQCSAHGIAVDDSGNAYVTGSVLVGFGTSNFPVTPGAFNTVYDNTADVGEVFLLKLGNTLPVSLVYSTFLGPGMGASVAVNPNTGEAFVTGTTYTTGFPSSPGALQAVHGGATDAFVLRMNAAGSDIIYSTFLGGAGYDEATDIVVNGVNEAYVAGIARDDFPTSPGGLQPELAGGLYKDLWVVQLNGSGTGYGCGGSTYFGGTQEEYYGSFSDYFAPSISLHDHNGVQDTLSINATSHSQDFPTTPGAYEETKVNGIADQPVFFKMSCQSSALPPVADFNAVPAPTCTGASVDFVDASANGATAWTWSFPGGVPSSSSVQDPQDIVYPAPGAYTVTLVACNAQGCDTLEQTLTIVTAPPPVISLGNDTALCDGVSILLTAAPGFSSYVWSFNGSTLPDATSSITVNASGSYSVLVSDSTGCAATDTVLVIALETPIADFTHERTGGPCSADGVRFTATTAASTYTWTFGDGTGASGPIQDHAYVEPDTYTVQLTVAVGPCTANTEQLVEVTTSPLLPSGPPVMPNVFSPNGDGVNDCFAPPGLEHFADCYQLSVFDRWGLRVFGSGKVRSCWKGTNDSGDALPEGVYFYLLTIGSEQYEGTVDLLR